MQKPDGSFHNYLSYERTYLDVDGSEDAAGRTLWACGCAINSNLPRDMRLVAKDIFDRGLPRVWNATHLRFVASTLLGLREYYAAEPSEELRVASEKLADGLVRYFRDETKDGWRWFEPHLTYGNARLPQALFAAYMSVKKPVFLEVAEKAMDFLVETQMIEGVFVPVGSNGWYKRGGERAFFDQQPIEASAMVDAALDAYVADGERRYLKLADDVFEWFLGRNSCKLMIYNPETSGCYDGLSAENVNPNQGAESSVCYLLARLRLEEAKRGFLRQKRI